jgi:hypothetical protein
MKQPFRYFRGEFNGKYLYSLAVCPNYTVKDILDELAYQALFQWKTEEEAAKGEMPIRDEDIVHIGEIAGVFQAFGWFESNVGSIYFTQSHAVKGAERSERGLFDMDREVFEYVRVDADDYPDDIANEASPRRRISVVPAGMQPVGYVATGTPLFNRDGSVIWDNVLPEPPADTAYVPFFGEKYLVFEEKFIVETTLTVPILKLLIECLQRVRYQGPSIALFMDITKVLCDSYVYDIDIIPRQIYTPESTVKIDEGRIIGTFKIGRFSPAANSAYYEVQYKLNQNSILDNLLRRFAVWRSVCRQKFKLFQLAGVSPGIEG